MSWRTTTCGVLAIVAAAINSVAIPLLDGIPSTQPDWTTFGAVLLAGIGLLFARDNKVSSEQAGIK